MLFFTLVYRQIVDELDFMPYSFCNWPEDIKYYIKITPNCTWSTTVHIIQGAKSYNMWFILHKYLDFICSFCRPSQQKVVNTIWCTCPIQHFPCSVMQFSWACAGKLPREWIGWSEIGELHRDLAACEKLHVCLSSIMYTELVYQASPSLTFQKHFSGGWEMGWLDRLTLCMTLFLGFSVSFATLMLLNLIL